MTMTDPDPWDEYAESWDDDPAARTYSVAAFRSLLSLLDARSISLDGLAVCDFGCGTGLLTEQLVDRVASVDAVDTSPAMRAVLAAKIDSRNWNHVRTLAELPSSGPSYDLVVCSSVCGFVDDYPGVVQELASRLRPSGLFVQWDWEREDPAEPHGLSRDEVRNAMLSAGLGAVHVDTAFEAAFEGETMRPLMGAGQASEPEP